MSPEALKLLKEIDDAQAKTVRRAWVLLQTLRDGPFREYATTATAVSESPYTMTREFAPQHRPLTFIEFLQKLVSGDLCRSEGRL
jgi:hypothetical protein